MKKKKKSENKDREKGDDELRIMSGKERPITRLSTRPLPLGSLRNPLNVQRACLSEKIQRIVFT
jgi:hypothetical protein